MVWKNKLKTGNSEDFGRTPATQKTRKSDSDKGRFLYSRRMGIVEIMLYCPQPEKVVALAPAFA